MRKISFLVLLIFLIGTSARGQVRSYQSQFEREAGFELFLSQGHDEVGSPTIDAEIAIPYKRLVFFLREGRYEARFRIIFEVTTTQGKRVAGIVWEETVATRNFLETRSMAVLARSMRKVPINPGEYRVIVKLEVLDTSRSFVREESVRIIGEGDSVLDISAPVLFASRIDSLREAPASGSLRVRVDAVGGSSLQESHPVPFFADLDIFACIRYDIAIPKSEAPKPAIFSMRIRDSAGELVQYYRMILDSVMTGRASIYLDLPISSWRIGQYEVESALESGDSRRLSESGYLTILLNRGLFENYRDDLSLLLSLVGDRKEAESVVQAEGTERIRQWKAMWERKDPTPGAGPNEALEEFLARLRYVLENFSGKAPGFRTDRGKVYISEGPPDRIETRGESSMRSYELWYYQRKGIVFIFEDSLGTGEYRLITTRLL